jgi:galactonate dehydratase
VLSVPVHALFGGTVRNRLPVYWPHCGSYRVRFPEMLGVAPLRTYGDMQRLGEEVRRRGFRALKTNIMMMEDGLLVFWSRNSHDQSGGRRERDDGQASGNAHAE